VDSFIHVSMGRPKPRKGNLRRSDHVPKHITDEVVEVILLNRAMVQVLNEGGTNYYEDPFNLYLCSERFNEMFLYNELYAACQLKAECNEIDMRGLTAKQYRNARHIVDMKLNKSYRRSG
jgi:hypothetical protein